MARHKWLSREATIIARTAGVDDPVLGMRRLVRNRLAEMGANRSPVDVSVFASFCGVRRVQVRQLAQDGALVVGDEGIEVQVNEASPLGRRRFTIAHESAHLLVKEALQSSAADMACVVGNWSFKHEVEYLCDVGASEVLMPEALLVATIDPGLINLAMCLRVAKRFLASRHAATRRLVELATIPCAVVVLAPGYQAGQHRQDQPGVPMTEDLNFRSQLRVFYCCPSVSWPRFIPANTSALPGGPIWATYESGAPSSGWQQFGRGRPVGTFWIECVAVDFARDGAMQRQVLAFCVPSNGPRLPPS